MGMYYPQATTLDMGPTEILPGSQYYTVGTNDPMLKRTCIAVPSWPCLGTLTLYLLSPLHLELPPS